MNIFCLQSREFALKNAFESGRSGRSKDEIFGRHSVCFEYEKAGSQLGGLYYRVKRKKSKLGEVYTGFSDGKSSDE